MNTKIIGCIKKNLLTYAAVPLLITGYCAGADERGSNFKLQATPVKKNITIDGKDNDWDHSRSIFSCYSPSVLGQSNSVRTTAAYDTQGLYLLFKVKDQTPMINNTSPKKSPGSAWKEDCIQLRLWLNPDTPNGNEARIVHLDLYNYTKENIPVASVRFGELTADKTIKRIQQAVGSGVEMAFNKDNDGTGYTLEVRIDWKLLTGDTAQVNAGKSIRMGMQYSWNADGNREQPAHRYTDLININQPQRNFFWRQKSAWGELQLSTAAELAANSNESATKQERTNTNQPYPTSGVAPITYTLEGKRNVTLVIEKPDGTRVRNLISDYPRSKGSNTDFWDGTDDAGKLVAAGEYIVRGLSHKPLDLLYQFQYGSPGNPPWVTSDGKGDWLSDHASPVGVTSDGKWTYLSHHFSESGFTVIGLDESGQKRWGINRIPGGPLAVLGGKLYMLTGGGHPTDWGIKENEIRLAKIDARKGEYAKFSSGKSNVLLCKLPADRKFPIRAQEGLVAQEKSWDANWYRRDAIGLAAANNKLYATLYFANEILEIDPTSGKVINKIAIEKPAGVAGDSKGNLYVVSGKTVYKITPDSKHSPVITENLTAPFALTCDGGGNIYVSDWKDQMCVKVFTAEGRLLRTVGKPGGRSLRGKYQRGAMFMPAGLAVDGRNQLWVAEYDFHPKRFSVWSESGKLVNEYCGPTWYGATECNVDTLNPRRAYFMGNIVDLDWKKGLWRVAATLWRPVRKNEIFGPRGEHGMIETIMINGKKHIAFTRSPSYFCLARLDDDGAHPLMARGTLKGILCTTIQQEGLPEILMKRLTDDPKQMAYIRKNMPRCLRVDLGIREECCITC